MKKMMLESPGGFVKMNREQMDLVEGGSLTAFIVAAVVSLIAVACNQTTTVNVYGGNECKTKTSSDTTSVNISADVPLNLK